MKWHADRFQYKHIFCLNKKTKEMTCSCWFFNNNKNNIFCMFVFSNVPLQMAH